MPDSDRLVVHQHNRRIAFRLSFHPLADLGTLRSEHIVEPDSGTTCTALLRYSYLHNPYWRSELQIYHSSRPITGLLQ